MSQHFSRRSHRQSAFTLIELLIVVAIIAILAAIAVPNFLEAQTRAKVSRVKADMRSFATAMESYTVDNNKPSPTFNVVSGIVFPWNGLSSGDAGPPDQRYNRFAWLTTPIAYITSAFPDPFVNARPSPNERILIIQSPPGLMEVPDGTPNSGSIGKPSVLWREQKSWNFITPLWVVYSAGPDRDLDRLDANYAAVGIQDYDPTNGTVSDGDIIRHRE